MKKRGMYILFLILVLIVSISIVYAISITYTYGLTNVNVIVYEIYGNSLLGTYSSGSGNTIAINYPSSSPSTDYYTYHYKQGYLPIEKTKDIYWEITTIRQQSSCKSQILSLNSPSSANKDEQFIITVNLNDITSVFPSLVLPTFIPSELTEYYKADTNVKLYIDNNLIETKPIKISTTGNNLQFTTSISTTGSHNIKIETEVTDDQCSSYLNPQTSLATITITQPTSYQCSDGTDNDGDGLIDYPSDPGCASSTDDNEYNAPTTNPCTITDWECNDWSQCSNSEQTRTCTKKTTCDGETGKPTETQSCTQCSDNYDNDNDNKIDLNDPGCSSTNDNDETDLEACPQTGQTCPNKAYEKCPTGHPKCSCTGINDLKAYLCTPQETCPGTTLTHNDQGLGTCCSVQCTKAQDPCTEENKKQFCAPDEDGCIMQKTCKNGFWTDCEKYNKGCQIGETCIDGTSSGLCSNTSKGDYCWEGSLINDISCQEIPCSPNWYCTFTDCIDNSYKKCLSGYIDLNKCNITTTPSDTQPCGYQNPITEDEFHARLKSEEGELGSSEGIFSSKDQSADLKSTLNQLLGIPKAFSVELGFETPFILLIIAIFLVIIFMHYYKPSKTPKKPKKKEPEETKKVKVNDLLLSVIESLTGDERKVVDKLIEMEGARVDILREKVGINKTKMEIALQKLEKRQIIKERTDDNSKLYFNDWLK